MARPKKERIISQEPKCRLFKASGEKPSKTDNKHDKIKRETIELSADECEAIRLAQREGVSMKEGAKSMNISAPTFNRILTNANKKIADALINAKNIKICSCPLEKH